MILDDGIWHALAWVCSLLTGSSLFSSFFIDVRASNGGAQRRMRPYSIPLQSQYVEGHRSTAIFSMGLFPLPPRCSTSSLQTNGSDGDWHSDLAVLATHCAAVKLVLPASLNANLLLHEGREVGKAPPQWPHRRHLLTPRRDRDAALQASRSASSFYPRVICQERQRSELSARRLYYRIAARRHSPSPSSATTYL